MTTTDTQEKSELIKLTEEFHKIIQFHLRKQDWEQAVYYTQELLRTYKLIQLEEKMEQEFDMRF